ncbi:hypothetical protein C4D60_Mb03t00150 [Musa balbisiana]|uniref:C3H1-type domain-containing protein n=1 Tax=Musa balbisiana TaxID=52838 RepID=A0A4S8J6I6_MUSBA|nr:hypothetical protein C4D60_Mb03t00150 [Musa balbisiana]
MKLGMGSDCEYRHNQGARMNPRDCWYWLKGNCLNPKCSFRHPPLDSWFATPMPTSGPLQLLQTAPTTQIPAACAPLSNNINKKRSPCYYFQRGQCLKGEWCSFIHGPQEFSSSVLQKVAKASTCLAEPPATIKDTQQNINMQQNAVKLNRDKPKATVEMPVIMPPVKVVIKDKNASEDDLLNHKVLPPNSLNGEPPALPHNPHNFVPTSGACSVNHQLQPLDEQPVDGRDTDELLHEYSPGFDVLVEDDIEDPDFFHNEDNFGRVSAHGGQHLEPENERHRDYEPMTRIERNPCNGIDKYDNYEQTQGRYGWDLKTSDRILDKPSSLERRVLDNEKILGGMDDSDLRHQLLKKRKLNGSRSTGGFDGHGDYYQRDDLDAEKRDYGHHSRDQRQFSPEKSLSIRLQGRITFPGWSSVDIASNLNLEKERGSRPRDRHSPVRRMNHQTKRPGRIKQQLSEDFSKDTATKNIRNKPTIGDDINSPDFAGPKSIAELKGARINGHSYERSIKSIIANTNLNRVKTGQVERLQESEDSLSFEGPKPLSDILKRKRELAYTDSEISTGQHKNMQGGGERAVNDSELVAPSLQSVTPLDAEKETNHTIDNHKRHKFRVVEDGLTTKDDDENLTNEGQSSAKADDVEIEENVEDELENYNQRDEDFGHGDENTFQGDEDEFDD